MSQDIKSRVISSLFWKFMERGGTQAIQFVVQIVLARLLLPEDFGLIAIVSVFILLGTIFVQSGFNTALIQNKDASNVDFSSIFYLSLIIAGLLYVIVYFTSPVISDFYGDPRLTSIIRVLSIILFLSAFNSIQNAFVARNMIFKKLFFSSLGAMVVSGIVGIVAAYYGLGIWALVAYQMTNQLAITVILWFTVRWRPQFIFSFERVKVLFSYGWKLMVSSLINTLYEEIRTLIVGRIFNPTTLGFYSRGQQFPNLIVSNIDGSIQSVMLPALASQQENREIVKAMMRRAIISSSFLIFPVMIGLAAVAEPAVQIILTEKWLPAVPFIQMFCAAYILQPIHTANLQAINALGRSDIYLKIEVVKKVIGVIILGISIPFGIFAIAGGVILMSVIATFINAYPNKRLLNYSYLEQWKDIMPALLMSVAIGAIVYVISFINISTWQILVIQIVTGTVLYFGLAKIFNLESFNYLILTLKEIVNSRRAN